MVIPPSSKAFFPILLALSVLSALVIARALRSAAPPRERNTQEQAIPRKPQPQP